MIKKTFLISSLFLALSSFIYSFDYGASITSYTKVETPSLLAAEKDEFKTFALKQEEILTGWLRHDFSPTMYLAAEADVRFRTTNPNLDNTDNLVNVFIPDLKLFRFFKKFALSADASASADCITLNAGRIFYSDITGTVLNQPADGFNLSYSASRVKARLYANYTGLLNAQNVTILNKKTSSYLLDPKKPWYFAAPYTNAGFAIEFPYLFANQTLSAEFLASFGSGGIESGTTGYNRLWGSLGLNGFLLKNLCYVFTTTFGSELEDGISNLTKLSVTYLPNFKNMAVSIFGHYASGQQLGLKPFKGFTKATAVAAPGEPEYSGITKAGASISIKPLKSIFTALNTSAVFSCPKDEFEYKGFEAGLTGVFQVFSDLNINGNFTQFFAKESNNSKATFTLAASLAF